MMSMTLSKLTLALALVGALISSAAQADTLITNFNNYNLGGTYAAWADANVTTITSNPTDLRIESLGFGGGFAGADPFPTNGAGNTMIEFDVTVNSGDTPNVLAVLEDSDGTQYSYRWYVLPAGNHVLTQPLTPVPGGGFNGISYDSFNPVAGTTPGFNFSAIQFFHIQVDAHGSNVPYDISFNNLRLVVPEPASIATLATGVVGLLFVGRRRSR
jgi:hypothetical protein